MVQSWLELGGFVSHVPSVAAAVACAMLQILRRLKVELLIVSCVAVAKVHVVVTIFVAALVVVYGLQVLCGLCSAATGEGGGLLRVQMSGSSAADSVGTFHTRAPPCWWMAR